MPKNKRTKEQVGPSYIRLLPPGPVRVAWAHGLHIHLSSVGQGDPCSGWTWKPFPHPQHCDLRLCNNIFLLSWSLTFPWLAPHLF